jgi:hypothetical protein
VVVLVVVVVLELGPSPNMAVEEEKGTSVLKGSAEEDQGDSIPGCTPTPTPTTHTPTLSPNTSNNILLTLSNFTPTTIIISPCTEMPTVELVVARCWNKEAE